MKKNSVKVLGEDDRGLSLPNRYQVVNLAACSESVYVFLYSAAIPNVMSDKFANKLRLELSSTESRIIFADETLGSCVGSI